MVDLLLPLRAIQFLFAIISLGLNGYGMLIDEFLRRSLLRSHRQSATNSMTYMTMASHTHRLESIL